MKKDHQPVAARRNHMQDVHANMDNRRREIKRKRGKTEPLAPEIVKINSPLVKDKYSVYG